jgi:ribosome biogenesis GTPase
VIQLERIGYSPFFSAQIELLNQPNLVPARIAADARDVFPVIGTSAAHAEPSGRLRQAIEDGRSPRPAVGDWLAVTEHGEQAIIHAVLDRKTCLRRRAAGSDALEQVIAANVDTYLIVTAVGRDLNPRRLERYLAAVWDSGASPIVVLNKCDLTDSADALVQVISEVTLAAPIVTVSAETGYGIEALVQQLGSGRTTAMIGSSGVGKSSLINVLCGHSLQQTSAVGTEGKGRHTTTRRELIPLPQGGALIDTPGLREFGIVEVGNGLEMAFQDVFEFATRCHFADCTHVNEPGCAVIEAVSDGSLSKDRVERYLQLREEAQNLRARSDPQQIANNKRRWKTISKSVKSLYKIRDKWK